MNIPQSMDVTELDPDFISETDSIVEDLEQGYGVRPPSPKVEYRKPKKKIGIPIRVPSNPASLLFDSFKSPFIWNHPTSLNNEERLTMAIRPLSVQISVKRVMFVKGNPLISLHLAMAHPVVKVSFEKRSQSPVAATQFYSQHVSTELPATERLLNKFKSKTQVAFI